MKNSKIFPLLVFNAFAICIYGQVQVQKDLTSGIPSNLSQGVTKPGYDEAAFHREGFETMGNFSNRIKYSDIKGSPFWNSDWKLAAIYDTGNNFLARVKVKVNLATQEIFFLDKQGKEIVASKELATKVVLYEGTDTSKILTIFHTYRDIYYDKKIGDVYFQQLNQGKVQLLKATKKIVATADSLFGTIKTYHFIEQIYYFIRYNQKIEKIKKLNRDNIFPLVPGFSHYTEWIDQNRINFKKEADVIRFLDYYNSNHK